MQLFVFLLLLTALIYGMPDNMCFTSTVSSNARLLIRQFDAETERACQIACGDNSTCLSISYSNPACFLLGAETSTISCSTPSTTQSKTTSNCPARTDPRAELGTDPCTSSFYSSDLGLDREGICNRTKDYILRGVDEFGARVSLDNDGSNILSFNATRNMWRFKFIPTGYTKWLVAVTCATADATCGCAPLPMLSTAITGGKEAQAEANGACANTAHRITFFGAKFKPGSNGTTFVAAETKTMTIRCKAGIWLLTYIDNHNGWQIVNATCAP